MIFIVVSNFLKNDSLMILNGYLDNFEHFFGLEMGLEVTFYIVAQVIENIFFMKFLYFILFYFILFYFILPLSHLSSVHTTVFYYPHFDF